ncbi:hypothetical protein [Nocardia sp. NPDC020380]
MTDEETYADYLTQMPQPYADAFMDFYSRGTLDESTVPPQSPT